MKSLFFRRRLICFIALFVSVLASQAAAQVKPLHENERAKIDERSSNVIQPVPPDNLKVILLGTGVGPPVNLRQYGASTLVEAGGVRLLFDCGRGATFRLAQVGVPLGSISRLFLTHLHSDHVIQIPDLLLTGWVDRKSTRLNSSHTDI